MIDKLSELIEDERAVSPVIGVILMVAITVILAAVIGTFVLDIGQSGANEAPQASMSVSVDANDNSVTVEHTGGSGVNQEFTRVLVETGGTTIEYNATSEGILSVGDETTFYLTTTSAATGSWSSMVRGTGDTTTFNSGEQVKITIIDTDSQRQIFQTTVTA